MLPAVWICDPVPGDRAVRPDKQVGIDVSELAVGIEPDPAVVDARAGDERIAVPEQLCVIGELQRAAEHAGVGRGAIDRAVGARCAGDERDRCAGGIEDLEIAGQAGRETRRRPGTGCRRAAGRIPRCLRRCRRRASGGSAAYRSRSASTRSAQVELAVDGGERHLVLSWSAATCRSTCCPARASAPASARSRRRSSMPRRR